MALANGDNCIIQRDAHGNWVALGKYVTPASGDNVVLARDFYGNMVACKMTTPVSGDNVMLGRDLRGNMIAYKFATATTPGPCTFCTDWPDIFLLTFSDITYCTSMCSSRGTYTYKIDDDNYGTFNRSFYVQVYNGSSTTCGSDTTQVCTGGTPNPGMRNTYERYSSSGDCSSYIDIYTYPAYTGIHLDFVLNGVGAPADTIRCDLSSTEQLNGVYFKTGLGYSPHYISSSSCSSAFPMTISNGFTTACNGSPPYPSSGEWAHGGSCTISTPDPTTLGYDVFFATGDAANGRYSYAGISNGRAYYTCGSYYLYYYNATSPARWAISTVLGQGSPVHGYSTSNAAYYLHPPQGTSTQGTTTWSVLSAYYPNFYCIIGA